MILVLAPFRVVDAIDPALSLHDDVIVVGHEQGFILMLLLATFDGNGAVQVVVGVDQ